MRDEEFISTPEAQQLLTLALSALVSGDVGAVELFTDDVTGVSPNMWVRSRTELENQLLDRQGALSRIEFSIDHIERELEGVRVTWRMSGDHTGELMLNEDMFFEPSGRRIDVSATSHVQFRSHRICSFQTIYDDGNLLEQIRVVPPPGAS